MKTPPTIVLQNTAVSLWLFGIISYFIFSPSNMHRLSIRYIDQGRFLLTLGIGTVAASQITARVAIGHIALKHLTSIGLILSSASFLAATLVSNTQSLILVGGFAGIGNGIFSLVNSTTIGLLEKRLNRLLFPVNIMCLSLAAFASTYVFGFLLSRGFTRTFLFAVHLVFVMIIAIRIQQQPSEDTHTHITPMTWQDQVPSRYQLQAGCMGLICYFGLYLNIHL